MQKVEGSSPFIRFGKKPRTYGVFCCPRWFGRTLGATSHASERSVGSGRAGAGPALAGRRETGLRFVRRQCVWRRGRRERRADGATRARAPAQARRDGWERAIEGSCGLRPTAGRFAQNPSRAGLRARGQVDCVPQRDASRTTPHGPSLRARRSCAMRPSASGTLRAAETSPRLDARNGLCPAQPSERRSARRVARDGHAAGSAGSRAIRRTVRAWSEAAVGPSAPQSPENARRPPVVWGARSSTSRSRARVQRGTAAHAGRLDEPDRPQAVQRALRQHRAAAQQGRELAGAERLER